MKYNAILLTLLLFVSLWGCGADEKVHVPDRPEHPVVIVYENDVHCAVDGYARMTSLRNDLLTLTPYVTTVSCGDFVQGGIIGSVSKGENLVEIMNGVGYDVVTLGNHEFDYGMSQVFKLTEALDAPVVCANFRDLRSGERIFAPYQMLRYGDVDIAYIGFTTTTTMTNVSPLTFQDEQGNKIYDFMQDSFYENAQQCIDKALSEGADYVVVLSHLGDMDKGKHASSIGLITHTQGIDVVLDGHDHHVIADTLVHDLQGTPVLLTSTGTKFANVGILTLSAEGEFSSRLVPVGNGDVPVDAEVQTLVESLKEKAMSAGERLVGYNEVNLSINDASGERLVRRQETAIGNFCADAFRLVQDVDVAFINGGGIRADLSEGDVTFNDLLSVFPFNNTACTATMTGQQLLDAMEFSVSFLPNEDGSFMQVSGLKFEVDASVPSPVVVDEDDLFLRVDEAPRRVSNLQIWDKESGEYRPVELEKTYTLASFSYQLEEMGCAGMFRYAELKESNLGQDVEVLENYIERVLGGRIGQPYDKIEGRIVIK